MNNILIVNADDFGMTTGHNKAIVDAYRNGIVTSTSILANGNAFDDAVSHALELPGLGVGIHLTLTEGPPTAPNVRELTGPNGNLPLSNQPFARALIRGQLPRAAIQRELEAQVTMILAAGIHPTHIDGHKYIHTLPFVNQIAVQLARKYAIPVMRVPFPLIDRPTTRSRISGMLAVSLLGFTTRTLVQRAGLRVPDRIAGFVDTGHLRQSVIRQLLAKPRPGVTELLCHPAYRTPALDRLLAQGYRWIAGYDFDGETAAVSDPALRDELERIGWTFGNYSDIHYESLIQDNR